MTEKKQVYGVDLDGTLAHYDHWKGPEHIGEPIPVMMNRVKDWIAQGIEVRIFTARAQDTEYIPYVKAWIKKHGLPDLEVTNVKRRDVSRIYDDRAVQIQKNTGKELGDPSQIMENYLELIQLDKEGR